MKGMRCGGLDPLSHPHTFLMYRTRNYRWFPYILDLGLSYAVNWTAVGHVYITTALVRAIHIYVITLQTSGHTIISEAFCQV